MFYCADCDESKADTKKRTAPKTETVNKKLKLTKVPDLVPNIIDGDFLDQVDEPNKITPKSETVNKKLKLTKVPDLVPNIIDGDFLDQVDEVKKIPDLLPNLIDGSFLKEQGDEKETDQKMETKTETEKKMPKTKAQETKVDNKVSRRPNLPKLIIPEPPKNKKKIFLLKVGG